MKAFKSFMVLTLVLLGLIIASSASAVVSEPSYQLQICWGPFVTDSGWKDISASYDIAHGTAVPNSHSGKLGEQHSMFQLNEDMMAIFTFNIASLPYNLAYNSPSKKYKVYTNVYWVRFKATEDSNWSAPSDWVAITYIK